MAKRPLTQKELSELKTRVSKYVTITNICKQMVPLQLRSPLNGEGKRIDFFIGERTVNLRPGESDSFPEDQLMNEQIMNLRKKGMIRVGAKR
jgi:hypothetical protein